MKKLFRDFRIIDSQNDFYGSIYIEDHIIQDIIPAANDKGIEKYLSCANVVFSGRENLAIMPGFIDLHAHFRDPGYPEKEVLESACLSAARGGWTSAVCMANTKPVIDNETLAGCLRQRAAELGIIDLFPVISLTKAMHGQEITTWHIPPRLLSEDGKDILDNALFLKALQAAAKQNILVSCHCDLGGESADVQRAIQLGQQCRLHIAHVSTAAACNAIRTAKQRMAEHNFVLTAEATPHHIALTSSDAQTLGADTNGKVAPPLASEDDRRAVIEALRDGVIDAIATDHAPHTAADKAAGSPGFTGFETAFSVLNTILVNRECFSLTTLSRLLSETPAQLLALDDRGRILKNYRADLTVVDITKQTVIKDDFFSRGKNSPFLGKALTGEIVMTLANGVIVYERRDEYR